MKAKDFQKATADRILQLFTSYGQRRVLLADEVGLGKTIIAKEVIERLAKWHKEKLNDDHFKVLYICSNINIARQNAKKLGIKDTLDVSESRLSMQHLKIYESKRQGHDYKQLIPLTPATSFTMTIGCGTVGERALMYAHLKRMPCFSDMENALYGFMSYDVSKSWPGAVEWYEGRVIECDKNGSNYIAEMQKSLQEMMPGDLIKAIRMACDSNRDIEARNPRRLLINELRRIFAGISLGKLEPDLVIMDEFQRFRDLIKPSVSEQGMLSDKFLHGNTTAKVLLLSATPYKLYSTLEEIAQNGEEFEHYNEFMEVMDFLFYDKDKNAEFKEVWRNYSCALREMGSVDLTVLVAYKDAAEDKMYGAVCRTERINSGIIDDSQAAELNAELSEADILSYIQAQQLMDYIEKDDPNASRRRRMPIDYVKSSPYLLSFMENYEIKKDIVKYFEKTGKYAVLSQKNYQNLLLRKNALHCYKKIPMNNARLEKLKEVALGDEKSDIDLLLWIPPSKPYYKTRSVFDKNKYYSKTLVFSAWEMVPRMISVMMSYEAERRTLGKLYDREKSKRGKGYFMDKDERRHGSARLRGEAAELLCYPSKFLADAYDPANYMDWDISKIKEDVRSKIEVKLRELRDHYSLATSGTGSIGSLLALLKAMDDDDDVQQDIGPLPTDTRSVLVDMAIGSPAVCAYRLFQNKCDENSDDCVNNCVREICEGFVSLFNKPESAAILDIIYEKEGYSYYRSVFEYCADGNMQAMLDEYAHVLDTQGKELADAIRGSFLDTSNIQIDTLESFTKNGQKARMRLHFAAGYFDVRISDESVARAENIRNAFNSPFRPFVLATTSIGQEGLDFHLYCRRVMHWNLPANPIDIEQREGRVNRYKCLAVRQNIAKRYVNGKTWDEMFEMAALNKKNGYSDIVPYWCLQNVDDNDIKIERIVPMYPFSEDRLKYERLIKMLAYYRLTLGQPRQEEMIEMLRRMGIENVDDRLFIDLSPFNKL